MRSVISQGHLELTGVWWIPKRGTTSPAEVIHRNPAHERVQARGHPAAGAVGATARRAGSRAGHPARAWITVENTNELVFTAAILQGFWVLGPPREPKT